MGENAAKGGSLRILGRVPNGRFYFDIKGVRCYATFEPHTLSTWKVRVEVGGTRWTVLYHPDTREAEVPNFVAIPPLEEITEALRARPELKGFPDES
jgi:hypothetical protein